MRPCTGVIASDGKVICPPLCEYHQLKDGTYSLADVERFHIAMDEIIQERRKCQTQ